MAAVYPRRVRLDTPWCRSGRGHIRTTLGGVTRRVLAVDGALALLAAALTLVMLADGGLGTPSADSRGLDWLGVVLVLASSLPVAVRRLAALTVYATTGAATMVLLFLSYPLDVPLGPALAVYTVGTVYGVAAARRRLPALLAVAGYVPAAIAALALSGYDVSRVIVPEMLLWALILTGLWLAGDRAGLRRERIAELEERARQSEREVEHERRVAAAEERTRISRELHDSAGHAINVILMQAGAARLLYERDPAGARQAIATVEQVARRTIDEIDTLVRALRDGDRDDPPPADPTAIEELVERHRAGGLAVSTVVHGPRRALPHSVAWAAYRIVQEALTNAARHGAGSADLAVRFEPAALDIAVTNPLRHGNGSAARGGHGIVGMRERASLLGGRLEAGPRDGSFRLHARLPHREPASEPAPEPAPQQASEREVVP